MSDLSEVSSKWGFPAGGRHRLINLIFGYLLPALGLAWVFYNVHATQLVDHLAAIKWWWVAAAVACDILSYLCQGVRWRLLLRPTGEVSWLQTTQAIYVGLFANEVLPMRVGELVRAYLVSRWVGVGFVSLLPSIAVERLFDGVWLLAGFGLAAMFVPLPGGLLVAGLVLGITVFSGTCLLLYIGIRRPETLKAAGGAAGGRIQRRIAPLIERLQVLSRTRLFYLSLGLSLPILALQAGAFWLIMRASDLPLTLWAGAVVFMIVRVGTVVPNAPANVGTYQFFCVLGLTQFGVDKTLLQDFRWRCLRYCPCRYGSSVCSLSAAAVRLYPRFAAILLAG